jgi:DUF1009 family protein
MIAARSSPVTMAETDNAVAVTPDAGPLAVICCGGSLPATVARAAARDRRVVLFPVRGWADPAMLGDAPHHWVRLGQFGRLRRLLRTEGCRDVVFIGTLVRPALHEIRLDFVTAVMLPRLIVAFRGGDDRLLSAIAAIFAEHGFRVLGADQVAPEILVPEGSLGRIQPDARDRADIARALALLAATGPFDIGQAVVVADNRVLAIEAAEGTDGMLARIAALRADGRIRTPPGIGVLVKAPKPGQDRRFDLPSVGPQTVEGAVRAGLAGIAVIAGGTIIAEPQRLVGLADQARIFVHGVRDPGVGG